MVFKCSKVTQSGSVSLSKKSEAQSGALSTFAVIFYETTRSNSAPRTKKEQK
jgi:hypothetical protein